MPEAMPEAMPVGMPVGMPVPPSRSRGCAEGL